MSGLAAGIRLAHFGQRVCILERHYAVGGLNSYYRLNGRNYDVGLHAVTNYVPRGAKRGPLPRILRQLRLGYDELELSPQIRSRIAFPGVTLDFSNDPELLEAEVARTFPGSIDGFRRLQTELLDYDAVDSPPARASTREVLGQLIKDPLLVEMLLCPTMYYGCPSEHDVEFGPFSVLYRSILSEGFARPACGVRVIIKTLVRRFKSLGGELRLRSGVRKIAQQSGRAEGVELDDGEQIAARKILSSIGWHESLALCGPANSSAEASNGQAANTAAASVPGQLSFVESISTLDRPCRSIGHEHTIIFFNDHDRFDWRRPETLIDNRSGVICSPDNYAYGEDAKVDGAVRVTALANYDRWAALDPTEYAEQKRLAERQIGESAVRFVPDFRPYVVDVDTFTPTTIKRFTGHENGAVYGAPQKHHDGLTPLENLFICGTDQGFLGIIGALSSGIAMANRHFLKEVGSRESGVGSDAQAEGERSGKT